MEVVWSIVILVLTVIEYVISTPEVEEDMDLPVSKVLGLYVVKGLEKTLQKEFNQEYMTDNQLLQASVQVLKNMGDEDLYTGTDLTKQKNAVNRRRSARWRSEFGRRRSRSQILRRQKLNSQSLRSHLQHSKQASSSVER